MTDLYQMAADLDQNRPENSLFAGWTNLLRESEEDGNFPQMRETIVQDLKRHHAARFDNKQIVWRKL